MTEQKHDDACGASISNAELERIACEAGLYRPSGDKDGAWYGYKEELANFAELIAAREREECAKACVAWRDGVPLGGRTSKWAAEQCAEAIRMRSNACGEPGGTNHSGANGA